MMKKILPIFIFFLLIFPRPALAQTVTIPIPTTSVTPSPGPTSVNYELPYPGLLPGSPLYTFKVLRDRITEILTTDSIKKSEFYLLQADKRLAASLLLYQQGNNVLANTTMSKSQNYLEKSIDKMIEAKKSQKNVGDIFGKVKSSSAKQKEQIEILLKDAKGDKHKALLVAQKRAEQIENRVKAFKP